MLRIAWGMRDLLGTLGRVYDQYGPISELQLRAPFSNRTQRFVLAVGPRFNESTLGDPETFRTSAPSAPGPRNSAQRRIRAGIVAMNGPPHLHYRRLTTPPLRRDAVDGMIGCMIEIVDDQIKAWPTNGEVVDMWPLVKTLSRNVALANLFPADREAETAPALELADLITAHLGVASSPWVRLCPIRAPGLPYDKLIKHAELVETSASAWAGRRRGQLNPADLMSLVVNSPTETGAMPDDGQIAGHVMTLFGASYETCQTALLWTLFLLAQNKSAATALLDEVSNLRGDEGFSAQDLAQCPALDAVVNESLRLLPPVPYQVRKAARDVKLGDFGIAKNTRVILSAFLTNRLDALYPEPDRFRPDRWRRIDPSQYEFLDFSAGPRTCTGWWFAMTFLKVAVVRILRARRWTIVPGARVDGAVSITMAPRFGLPVSLHPQDGKFADSPIRGNISRLVRH